MRILLVDHCLLQSLEGKALRSLASSMRGAGNEVLSLVADQRRDDQSGDHQGADELDLAVQKVVCGAGDPRADLLMDPPALGSTVAGVTNFSDLTETQIAAYREAWREALERSVADFNPDVIHCLHLWLPAHAALETGVPYVAAVVGPELDAALNDRRYRRFVEQVAQNAGRILAVDDKARQQLLARYPELEDRTLTMAPASADDEPAVRSITARTVRIYAEVLSERRGVTE